MRLKERTDHDRGPVAILPETHDALGAAVVEAYGWAADLSDQQILTCLVALTAERQAEEAAGLVRLLRPAFQAPGETTQATLDVPAAATQVTAAELEVWPAETRDRPSARGRGRGPAFQASTPRAAVADLLDTLVSLGQARHTEAGPSH